MNRKLIPVAALAAATLWFPSNARAFDMGNAIIGCFGADSAAANAVVAEAATMCEIDGPPLTACNVVNGDPTSCATLTTAPAQGEDCYSDEATYEIHGAIAAPVGWSIEGKATITWSAHYFVTDRVTCNPTPITPSPEGAGGAYVAESARAAAVIKLKVEGSFKITTPVGATVTVGGGATCTLTRAKRGSRQATVSACHARPCTGTTTGTTSSTTGTVGGGDALQVVEPCAEGGAVGETTSDVAVGEP